MLPIDFINFMPDPLVDNLDEAGQALREFINNFTIDYFNKILGIWYFKFPEITDSNTLLEWCQYLAADCMDNDTERQLREKIANAIQVHKLRGTWKFDIKIKIDNITGKDAQLVKNTTVFEDDDSIIVADNSPENNFFSTIGTDGVQPYGTYIPEIQETVELLPGIIAIDLGYTEDEIFDFQDDDSIVVSDNDAGNLFYSTIGTNGIDDELGTFITSGEISDSIVEILEKITEDLLLSVPAYEIIYLGYINDDGNFKTLTII